MRFEQRPSRIVPGIVAMAMAALFIQAAAAAVELQPYPRAKQLGRYDNPLEAGALPISPPQRSTTDPNRTSRVRLPYEGSVSIVQYKHEPDDSPLLIARHYAGVLKEQGFELVTICDLPCPAADGAADASVYWHHELDLAKKLNYGAYGDRGLYLIGHRADAIAAVRVGTGLGAYVSTVKTVNAANLDRAPLLAYVESLRAPAANAPLPAPPGRSPVTPPTPAATPAPSAFIKDVAPAELSAWVRQSKGWVVLQLTSFDHNCTYCTRANPAFQALAEREAPKSGFTFARVAFQPWTTVNQSEFVTQYGVQGVPAFFTFKDGQLMRRQNGNADEATLRQALLDGLR